MPDLSPQATSALRFWGVIQAGVSQGATTAELWQAIRESDIGGVGETGGVGAIGVGQLRGMAASIARASGALNRASTDQAIVGSMIADAPWGRPLAEQNTLSQWQVRYLATTITPEGEQQLYRTATITGTLPGTVGELLDFLNIAAPGTESGYNYEFVSLSEPTILAV